MNKISKENAEHYRWGINCEGWRFQNKPEISIIRERMPAGTSETMHFHKIAGQFFFMLKGKTSIETEEGTYNLQEYEGIEILPGVRHRFFNSDDRPIEFLVTSVPSTLNDRFEID
jgi:mannose-6-phosphate isomerase-like protein (cupin superfamily)